LSLSSSGGGGGGGGISLPFPQHSSFAASLINSCADFCGSQDNSATFMITVKMIKGVFVI
jgi:hypothetical protein